ncbi:hypothetical protein QC762_207970 [Podospora pseudocomata]|uniref:protein S-acyltransferase n=1 Tax=Podospora pseudocomata TaxID=2093779 RepID=A0ABR0GY81_9PEZI|nr:hypothetical protein QC762_207970 [Podospora pseudocomata]
MLDQVIILQDSAQRLSTTYNTLTYRVLCSDSSLRDLFSSIKTVSVALDSCRGLLEQLKSGTTSIPIPTDLSPRLKANLEECKEAFADADEKAKKLMPQLGQLGSTKLFEIFTPAEIYRLTSQLYARGREFYRVGQAIRLQTTSQLPQNILSNTRQPFGQPLQIRGFQPIVQFQTPRFQYQPNNTPNIDEKSQPTGHTTLHDLCATTGRTTKTTTVIKSLLERGADPTATLNAAYSQLTAVHIASYHNNVAALEAIKDSMTTIKTFTYQPTTTRYTHYQTAPSNYTSYQPTSYIGQYKWKSLLKQKDFRGMTPLHWAAYGVCPEAAEFLLKEVEDAGLRQEVVDGRDREGRTALIVLAGGYKLRDRESVTKIAKGLVKAGASLDVGDRRGKTARGMVVELGVEKEAAGKKEEEQTGGGGGGVFELGYQGGCQAYRWQGYQGGGQQSNGLPGWKGNSYQGGGWTSGR